MSESLLAMGDYDRISVREALGGGAGIPMFSLFTIHPSIIIGSFHSISTVSSLINKDKVESVVSSFFSGELGSDYKAVGHGMVFHHFIKDIVTPVISLNFYKLK
ncbi:hypothetical protein HanIR_Chr12g0582201 [Helianthus annuus]|nr:hypothetical protein HanIR_Chr12g0582201 [Helianthus annuus]